MRRYGVLTSTGDLSGDMILQAFNAIRLEHCSAETISPEQPRGISLGLNEWAEEIAAIGKRRNLLERRLRDLALNFIRFDALAGGRQDEIKARIVKAIDQKRHKAVQHLSGEEVINTFLWSDLVNLVMREWGLFERLFGDKSEFKNFASIINDRFDAHAKPADLADIGLYRRALRYLEDRISRVQ